MLCREDGGVLDDLFTYRLADDRYLTVTNAANHERDLAWFQEHAGDFDAEVADRLDDYAMLAVQGPDARGDRRRPGRGRAARAIAHGRADTRTPATPGRAIAEDVAGVVLVCGTGYTGEDGVEILLAPDARPALWDALLAAGATPAGLGARDTLRLEVCFHLYGNDLSDGPQPDRGRPRLVLQGGDGLHRLGAGRRGARRAGPPRSWSPSSSTERGIPRQGNAVLDGRRRAGGRRSRAARSRPRSSEGIGMAYVRAELAEPGTEVEIDVRGKRRAARIESRPLYDDRHEPKESRGHVGATRAIPTT